MLLPGAINMPSYKAIMGETIKMKEVATLEIATQESVHRLGGALGWGAAGAALLGPAGLIAGLVLGGRGKQVTFVLVFKDGRKAVMTADQGAYRLLEQSVRVAA